MNLFEDKTPMPDNAHVKRASDNTVFLGPMPAPRNEGPVRVSQTLQERYADRADDAQSVVNVIRPRRGHGY
jgi:hypothetical protein